MKGVIFKTTVIAVLAVAAVCMSCEDRDPLIHYTIKFSTNGGNPTPENLRVKEGEKIPEPEKPVRENLTFAGWYTDEPAKDYRWNFDDRVYKSMTLYARWTDDEGTHECEPCECEECEDCEDCDECDVTYTVTYMSDGSVVNEFRVDGGSTLSEPVPAPRAGFTFDGWYADANYNNPWNFAGDAVTANVTLYAKWTEDGSSGEVVKLVETIMYDDGNYGKYEYDSQDRITKISWYEDGETTPYAMITFTYSGEDLIKTELTEDPGEILTSEFVKNGNKITVTQTRSYDGEVCTYTLDLNSDGTLAKASSSEDDYTEEISYQYQDGNLTKMSIKEIYDGEINTGTVEFKYDSKNSPFLHCKTPKWYRIWCWDDEFSIKNNITEMISDAKAVYTYEYDSDGYPIKSTELYDDEYEHVMEFTYIVK